jgi:hypothetical protein
MSYCLTIDVSIEKTDPNRILGVHKYAKHRIFNSVKQEINKLTHGKRPISPLTSFQISATRHSGKFLDWDNLVASLKPFIDGLVLSGVIKDDNWNFIKHINTDQVKSKEKKIVITVKEIVNG